MSGIKLDYVIERVNCFVRCLPGMGKQWVLSINSNCCNCYVLS